MTNDSVDLTNLRELIQNDHEMEAALFDEFISSSNALMKELETYISCNDQNEEWRKAAHALKGIAINLGAERLGELAKDCQEQCDVPSQDKVELFKQLETEHGNVLEFLKNHQHA